MLFLKVDDDISQGLADGEKLFWEIISEIQQTMVKVTNHKNTFFKSAGKVDYRSINNIQGGKIYLFN
ncbi:hypothetical protein [Cylindrospermum sp. FACHB-282]|uniref:hypothetical protein n=1 Tax=Cylindrospermum sp. FACHB-282 TaxID=2692794 RepID=UPI001986006C|nr:hypothetical protein [Cylindrospermum sp. FACHB-282]MBD2385656.1 hypothetical protein [Cylindrospermum sp. FACHB-282]